MAKLRRAVVAGMFYEGNAEALRAQVESCFLHPFGIISGSLHDFSN